MKGIELPINILVIIAMAVMVLLGLVAIYMGGFGPGGSEMQKNAAKNQACQELISKGYCGNYSSTKYVNVTGFDADRDGSMDPGPGITGDKETNDNLYMLCKNFYGCGGSNKEFVDCCHKKVCGCPI
jgi:hypothetical protein